MLGKTEGRRRRERQRMRCLDGITDSGHEFEQTPGEEAMAPHSSTLALKIPLMEEPGGLRSAGSQRVGQD